MSSNSKKKVLITGATGFTGKYIVEQALQSGYKVFLALRKESDTSRIDHLNFERVWVDFSSEETIAATLYFNLVFDIVVHNAGVKSCLNEKDYYTYNTELTGNLCKVLHRRKLLKGKFIYISSLAALGPGDVETLEDITETKEEGPISHYGRSKLLAEKEVLKSGLDFVVLRPTAIYGRGTSDYDHLIGVVKRGMAIYPAKPSQMLSFIHAHDVARIIFLVDEVSRGNQIFNVSDGMDYTLETFYYVVAKSIGVKTRFRLRIPLFALMGIARFNRLLASMLKINNALGSVDKAKEITALNWRCSAKKLVNETGFETTHSLSEIID